MADIDFTFSGDSSSLKQALAEIKDEVRKTKEGVSSLATKFGAVILAAQGAVAALKATYAAVSNIPGQAARMENLVTVFTSLSGSAETARALISDLWHDAANGAVGLEEMAAAAKPLVSVFSNVDTIREWTNRFADISAGSGIAADALSKVYARAVTLGKVDSKAIEGLAKQGVPIYQRLGEVIGASASRVKELAKDGAISADQYSAALRKMTDAGGEYFQLSSQLSNTSGGSWDTLVENVNRLAAALGTPINAAITPVLQSIAAAVEAAMPKVEEFSRAFVAGFEQAVSVLSPIVEAITSVSGALGGAKTIIAAAAAAVAEALAAVGFTAEAEGAMVSLVGDCRHAFVFDALNEDGYSVEVHVGMCREHEYSVYAWLEQPDGSAAWAYVGEAHDFATAEVAGIVKLATDVCCAEGGAPVANNKHGQMVVPHADYTVPGAVLPSEPKTMGSGAVVGFDEAGRMLVALAQYGRYGAVKPSLADVLNAGDDPYKCDDMQGCTGLMADGSLGVAWAQLNRGGAVRLGSELKEQNPQPYLVGVGATPDHKLANNLLYGGALQHKKPNDWTKDGLDWLKPGKYWDGDCFYLGLLTSDSFTQSQEKGLELMDAAAHEGLLGGVVVAHTVTGSPAVVPSGKAWVDYVTGYAYSKSHCDTTYETIRHAADTWEERSHAQATYETKTAAATRESRLDGKISLAQAELRGELNRLSSQKVDKTATWHGDVVLTQAEYNALGSIDPYIKYYIVEK